MVVAERGAGRRRRRWRRALIATVGVLALAVVALTAAAAVRGPRITGLELDRTALVERGGTRIVVDLDQSLAARPRVRVSPAAAVTATVAGRALVLTFARMLDYDTRYRIRITDAVGASTGARADLDVAFRSADAQVYSLVRGQGPLDRVVRRALGGGPLTTVYSARRIQRFAVLPAQLAVVTIDRRGNGTLVLQPLEGGPADRVTAPAGAIDDLAASGPSGLLSFTVTTPYGTDAADALDGALQVVDPTDGSGVAHAPSGVGGGSIDAVQTRWIPDSTSLIARGDDGSLALVDGTTPTARATPAGSTAEVLGVIPGSDLVVLSDPDGVRTLDLRRGRSSPLVLPSDGLPVTTTRSDPIVLDRAGGYLEVVSEPGADFSGRDYRILHVDRAGARVLWRPGLASTRIDRACLSPNAQYLAVEVIPAGATSDGYPGRPLYATETTTVIDLASGQATRSLPGADPSWCT